MQIKNRFTKDASCELPVIMAPMFLVSNENMIKAGMDEGILAVFPSLNFRQEGDLDSILLKLKSYKDAEKPKGNYGINLIVQKSNPLYEKHLKICISNKVPFYITSLGSPEQVINAAHAYGAKVYCDVTNLEHAKKCASLGCDGFIAVGQGAGGHAGPYPLHLLVPALKREFPDVPIVAAGGIASGEGILSMLSLGASAVSIGTRFIASTESSVSEAYKNAITESDMTGIVLTEKISGTPCTIIDTPFAKKIGYKQNWFEKLLSTNKTTKKYFKMLVQIRGMKNLERSIKPGNYETLWCAGQSVQLIHHIEPIKDIMNRLINEFNYAFTSLKNLSK